MADDMITPSNTNSPMASGGGKGSNKKSMYIVLIIALVVLNGFFIFNYWNTKNEKEKIEAAKIEVEGQLDDALADIRERKAEIEALSSENAELDSTRLSMIARLDSIELELLQAQKDAKKYKGAYYGAKKKLEEADALNKSIQEEIATLKEKIANLEAENDSLSTSLTASMEENQQLQSEKTFLSGKVELGSLLKPENVEVGGIRIRSNGVDVPIRSAKKTEKIKVSFTVPENKVAEPGPKTILVRIVSPSGSTIAVESQGSGVFQMKETGEQKQYTMKIDFDYTNKSKDIAAYWQQTAPFSSGDYKTYFYQDGYELGHATFELR